MRKYIALFSLIIIILSSTITFMFFKLNDLNYNVKNLTHELDYIKTELNNIKKELK